MANNTVHELGTNLEVVAAGKTVGQLFVYGDIPVFRNDAGGDHQPRRDADVRRL